VEIKREFSLYLPSSRGERIRVEGVKIILDRKIISLILKIRPNEGLVRLVSR
jgi:hypothetical protein